VDEARAGTGDVSGDRLVRLTAAKMVANFGFRWVPFFLPTLAAAFSATTRQMTLALGIGEMAGLSTLAVGRHLDRGRERVTMVVAMGLTATGSVLALAGRFTTFAAGYLLIILGVALCTVGGHTYLSRRVAFTRRARVLGLFETSWALALLIGAPVAAGLIGWVGWRGPFVAVAVAAVAAGFFVGGGGGDAPLLDDAGGPGHVGRLDRTAWTAILASSSIGITGLTTIVIAGTWLDEALGVSTGGVGAVAMAFGAAELIASSSSAAVADRAGPGRATRMALGVAMVGLLVMTRAGSSLLVGASGLFLFFIGFEFAIVTSFAIVSEAMPSARGRVLATAAAVGTLLRGAGVTASGGLYERFGISGPAGLSLVGAVTAMTLLTVIGRRQRRGSTHHRPAGP
jgi:predicted MFS family arabinose efflux permease